MVLRDIKEETITLLKYYKKKRFAYNIKMRDNRLSYQDQLEAAYYYEIYNTRVKCTLSVLDQLNYAINKTDRITARMLTSIAMIEDQLHI